MAINTPSQINQNLVRKFWDTKLADESMFRSLFSKLRTPFDRVSNVSIPMDAITMEFNAEANQNYRSAELGFLHALQGTPREGDLQLQIMNEETLRQKNMTIYFNEFSHAVSTWGYGIHFHDEKAYYDGMDVATKKLGDHAEELFDLYYEMALLQRYSRNVTRSPVNLTQEWNSRMLVKGVPDSQQPAYSLTLQTYTNNIGNAIVAAGTGSTSHLDAKFLNWLHTYLTVNRIEPLMINGKKRFILTVSPWQKFHVHDLDTDGSVAKYWTGVNRMNDKDRLLFPELLGEWINILLVENERQPTLRLGGSSSPFTITPEYVHPGNNDQRSNTVGTRDTGFVIGRAPIIDFYPTKIHHKFDDYNYKKWVGKGYFGMRGVQLRQYNAATPSAVNAEQRYCAVAIFGRGDIRNY